MCASFRRIRRVRRVGKRGRGIGVTEAGKRPNGSNEVVSIDGCYEIGGNDLI